MELVSRVGLVIGEWPSTITASHSESGRNIYQPNRIIINLSQSNQIESRTRNPDLSLDDIFRLHRFDPDSRQELGAQSLKSVIPLEFVQSDLETLLRNSMPDNWKCET